MSLSREANNPHSSTRSLWCGVKLFIEVRHLSMRRKLIYYQNIPLLSAAEFSVTRAFLDLLVAAIFKTNLSYQKEVRSHNYTSVKTN